MIRSFISDMVIQSKLATMSSHNGKLLLFLCVQAEFDAGSEAVFLLASNNCLSSLLMACVGVILLAYFGNVLSTYTANTFRINVSLNVV